MRVHCFPLRKYDFAMRGHYFSMRECSFSMRGHYFLIREHMWAIIKEGGFILWEHKVVCFYCCVRKGVLLT